MTRFRDPVRRFGELVNGSTGLSYIAIAVFSLLGLVGAQARSALLYEDALPQTLLLDVLIIGIPAVFLLTARHVFSRIGPQRVGAPAIIAVYLLGVLLRAPILYGMDASILAEPFPFLEFLKFQTLSSVITIVATLSAAAVVGLARERAVLTAQLEAEQWRLRETANSMEGELREAERELRMRAREILEPELVEIRRMLEERLGQDGADVVADRLMSSVRDVVRPASHALATPTYLPARDIPAVVPVRFNVFRDEIDVPAAIRPEWIVGVLMIILVTSTVALQDTWIRTLPTVLAMCAMGGFIALVRFAWPKRFRTMRVASGFLLITLLYIASYTAEYVLDSKLFGVSNRSVQPATSFLVTTTITVAFTLIAIHSEHAKSTRVKLVAVNSELTELIARMRRHLWLCHRAVALTVHGQLQSMLVSTAMRLRVTADDTSNALDLRRLDDVLASISTPGLLAVTLLDTLDELREIWSGVVVIDYEISPEALARMYEDAGLATCASEVCRESVTNAIRHGGATSIQIEVGAVTAGLGLTVEDDGQGVAEDYHPGLGLTMMDQTCLSWTLVNGARGGAALQAVLA
jgi:signal transduction histidine kinase